MTPEQTIDEILDGFGTYARWRGFDEAMGTVGKHTSSTTEESKAQARIRLLALLREAEHHGRRAEEHYWIDEYTREASSLSALEDPLAKNRCNIAKKLHQNRLVALTQSVGEGGEA